MSSTVFAPFIPLVPDPHLLTIVSHFWPRRLDTRRFPVELRESEAEPGMKVLIKSQQPDITPVSPPARVVLVHGLEGSADAVYMRGMAQAALESGYAVDRFQLRSCGGTEHLCAGFYHAGLTADLQWFLASLGAPVWLVGFSLGGNLVLKLAGELGDRGREMLAGVCAVSTPIDLAASARRIAAKENRLYERRFVRKLAEKVARSGLVANGDLKRQRSLWEFDDKFTAPMWGFGSAANYYATQSSNLWLDRISVPTLLVQAKDDPLIPFEIFDHPALRSNPHLELLAPAHGGHLGFIARRPPWCWLDRVVLDWIRRMEQLPLYTRLRFR